MSPRRVSLPILNTDLGSVVQASPRLPSRRVVLVCMPFAAVSGPSIGLGLLKAALLRAGHHAAILDLHLDFAQAVGHQAYAAIEQQAGIGCFAGEWLFSEVLFPNRDPWPYVHDVLLGGHPDQPNAQTDDAIDAVLAARAHVAPFVNAAAETILALEPEIVGFTSMFQQHVPSLAVAARLRELVPKLRLIIGGPNCDDTMGIETIRSFPFLDAVVLGEADELIVELVERLGARQSIDDLPGVLTPSNAGACRIDQVPRRAARVRNLDALPFVDYDDYVASRVALGLEAIVPELMFETSRGCWWGELHHCVFCGINPDAMGYRAKSAERVLGELRHLVTRYPARRLVAVDNILFHRYFRDLLPELAQHNLPHPLFFEVKSNLRDEQVRLMRKAGISEVQPGIESLSTELLDLMNKGVTGISNVALLKSCELHGIGVYWNLIWGFPGESVEAYRGMLAWFPRLHHLSAPGSSSRILLNRFSPHFDRAEDFGLVHVRPFPAYRHVYPFADERVERLAYYFCFDYASDAQSVVDEAELRRAVTAWRNARSDALLFHESRGEQVTVVDGRSAEIHVRRLEGVDAALLRAVDGVRPLSKLRAELGPDLGEALQRLEAAGLIVQEGERVLGLTLDLEQYSVNPDDAEANMRSRRVQTARRWLTPS